MNEPEAFQLLTLASARDGRKVSPSVAKVWAGDLSDIDLDEAVEAARMHYRESTEWLMPRHVIACTRRVREARAREQRRTREIEPRVFSDEGFNAYWAEVQRLKELKKAVGS